MIRAFNATDKIYNNNGDAVIAATKARVKNEDNGDFTLDLICSSEYNDYIQANNIIVVPTPGGDQAFRIRQVEKRGNKIEAKCFHVFYDAANYIIADSYAVNMTAKQALEHFNAATDNISPFSMDSDINTINNLRIVRDSLAEAVIEVIERWSGHLIRDNYNIAIKNNIGRDNGITIEYKKNLKELTASYDWSNVATKLLPVGKDGVLLNDLYVYSATQYDIPFTKTVSFQQDLEREDYPSDEAYLAALRADLKQQAEDYLAAACVPNINYTLKGNPEKVTDIGDIIEVRDARIGVNVLTKVIAYEYDCIANKYVSLEFGNFTPKLSSLMSNIKSDTSLQIANATSTINTEVNALENSVTIINNQVNTLASEKQDKLTPGENINITNNIISAKDTQYEAGENINITNNVISASGVNVLYGTDAPENSSGNNKDFYLQLLKNTANILSLDKFHNENSTEQNPIYLTDFTATSKNEYSFIINGCPDNQGHGEWCYFELDGLIEGNTYDLTFNMQFNSGATFPWGYYDYIEICGEKINFQKDSALHTYSCTFTYVAGGQMFFNFPAINDNVMFTATITDMVITGDFVSKYIAEIYNKHENNWRKYTPPASASSLSELTDVELTDLTDKDIIEWDEVAEKWKNKPNSGGGGGSNLILDAQIYSLEEKQVGVWIDGKPIYAKTYNVPKMTIRPEGTAIPSISISEVDTFVNGYGISQEYGQVSPLALYNYNGLNGASSIAISVDKIVMYYTKTTDSAGSGGYQAYGFSPIIYSEEEREVGVWVDNKPLYAKSFTLSSQITVSASSWTNTNLSLSDVEKFINGYALSDDGTFQGSVVVDKSNNVIQLQSTRSTASYVKYLTVFYTKTTDIAGSGSYNTLGVPNVHYKDDWHVVGTWWNGKPIYEKTFHFTTENLPADRATIEKIYNFDELVSMVGAFGYQQYTQDRRSYTIGEASPQLSNKAIYLLCEGNDQVNDIQDLDFNFNGLDRSKVVYISATVRITKTTD